jgi:pyruvate kinase
MTTKALIVDEHAAHRSALSQLLTRENLHVHQAATFESASQIIQEDHFDIVIVDLGPVQPRGRAGLLLTEEIKKRAPATQIVIVSEDQSVEVVVEAMHKGASDYIVKSDSFTTQVAAVVRKISRRQSLRRSKIVCTIGPATDSEERLAQLLDAGMDVARLNFSHGEHAWHRMVCERLRRLSDQVAIMGDIQGPKIRIGRMQEDRTVFLDPGATFVLTSRPLEGDGSIVSLDYPSLPKEVQPGHALYLNDGLLALQVEEVIDGTDIVTRVLHGGPLTSRKGINAPRVHLSATVPTNKDRRDIELAVALELDFLAVSFVTGAADLERVRGVMHEAGGNIPLISKIERAAAIDNYKEIMNASDGIMVARGDLAVEIPTEDVPYHQKDFIRQCNQAGVPVICATQMLESMTISPVPTRAEVNDVFNAILDGADAVMLSAESASGDYPIETVQLMSRIVTNAEASLPPPQEFDIGDTAGTPYYEVMGHGISTMVKHVARRGDHISAIVAITREGYSARMLAKYRPGVPIIAATHDSRVARQLMLSRGVKPMLLDNTLADPSTVTQMAILQALREGRVRVDDIVLTASGSSWAPQSHTNFIGLFAVRDLLDATP